MAAHWGCVLILFALGARLCLADVTLHGRVVDENDAPVLEARVVVAGVEAQTDPTGAFTMTLPGAGDFSFSVAREGYYALKDQVVHVSGDHQIILLINSVREVFQSQNVNAETSPVDVAQSQNQERLTGTEVNDMPFANSHNLRSSMQLMPGVLLDQSGALHVDGASENQLLYQLNGFNITNPISGGLHAELAVEGVRSMELSTGRYSPEFGKGTAGVLAINTENGTDQLHYTATDFVPGFNVQQGVRLGNWYPRAGISGPIVAGRAWFADTFDSEYTDTLVTGLPKGEDTHSGWIGSNLLHVQFNLRPSNILFADFLVNINNQNHVGLGPLSPLSTTSSVHERQYFVSLKDQTYFGHGMLVEFGYAHDAFSDRQTPQGTSLYIFSPEGTSGNYFVNSRQTATRDQGMAHAYLPQFRFLGTHRVEAGGDGDVLGYDGNFHRTGYEVLGLSNQLLSETLFPAPATFHVSNSELSLFVLDTWSLSKRLQVTLGLRQDWDRRIDDMAWSPRAAFSWSPLASGHMRIAGGYSVTHDAVWLDMLGQPLDQEAVSSAGVTSFAIGRGLVLPRAANWTVGVDHQISSRVYVTAKYLRRRGTDGFAYVNQEGGPASLLPLPDETAGIYQLTNLRRDDYSAVQLSVRQKLVGQFEWMASYTRSRATSNAIATPDLITPLQILPYLAPVPWDAPNRFLAWAYLPLPWKKWAVSGFLDLRSGFPYSVEEQTGVIVGSFDQYRYPVNFDLNIAIERMVVFRGYRFALRVGADNITGQANPTAVNNVVGGPGFGHFLGDEGRHFVARIRLFGR
jgi:hypothetical protein